MPYDLLVVELRKAAESLEQVHARNHVEVGLLVDYEVEVLAVEGRKQD